MKRLSLSLCLAAAVVVAGSVAPAAAATAPRHCVVRVVDRKPSGELVTSTPTCYASYAQARQAAQAPASGSEASTASTASAASSFTLAIHWDGPSQSGGSTTVVGSDCNGGWINTSSYWATNMESTTNGCNQVAHHTATNLGGSQQVTTPSTPGGNLSSPLFHHTYSVQYYT